MKTINQNSSYSEEYSENSFIGQLHEQNIWDDTEYFKLEDALYILCAENENNKSIPRDVAWPIMRIFSYIMLALGSHIDPNDDFEMQNINHDQFYSRRERQLLVFEGFFKGKMPNREHLGY